MRQISDQDQRRLATTEFRTNLVVLAGAGTGKTSLLVERMLCAVGSGHLRMEQLAAMTFTEKAAGEMRERLASGLERLYALARGAPATDDGSEAERAWRHLTGEAGAEAEDVARRSATALEQLDRTTVETIHGFCSALLRAHPVAAAVDPDFQVDAGEHAEVARRDLWASFIARELGSEAPRPRLWSKLFERATLEDVRKTAFALADFGVAEELLQPPFRLPDARGLLGGEAAELVARVDSMLERQQGMTPLGARVFRTMLRHLTCFRDEGLQAFQAAAEADAEFVHRLEQNSPPGGKRIEGVTQDEIKSVYKDARSFALKLLSIDEATTGLLIEAAAPFALAFRDGYLKQGFVGFDGLLLLARNLLRDHPEIRRVLKRRYRMLLVDEFQDTDPLQYEIVLYLAESPEGEARDPFSARLEPGKLFIVGDAKQSIYRFRGADYAVYRKAVERVVASGGRELILSANFRSVEGIVDPVNRLFQHASGCWEESAYQPPYHEIRAVRGGSDSRAAVELWTVKLDDRVPAHERRDAEGHLIAAEIERLVREERICRFSEITLLFRALTQLTHYLRPLRQRNIPFVVDGGREFLERPEVGHLMAALYTLAQPADQPALLAFLRSPAGAVPDSELAEYAAGGGRWNWSREVDAEAFPRIADRFTMLRGLTEEIRDLPADAVVRRVLERTLLLPLGAAAFEGPQRVANLRKLASAAGELARDGRLTLAEVVEALLHGRLTEIESDAPLADDAVNAVRITSIHRMKGLENSRIFLPDLARGEPRGPREEVAVRTARSDSAPLLALRVNASCNTAAVRWELDNERHERAEEVRVLYVALTRARNRLVLIAGPSRGRAPWVSALAPWGYDAGVSAADGAPLCEGRVLHRVKVPRPKEIERRHELPVATDDAVSRYELATERLRAAAERPRLATPSGLEQEPGHLDERAVPAAGVRGRELARATGIVVHRLFQGWRGESLDETLARLAALCDETAPAEAVDRQALEVDSRSIVESFLDSPLAAKLRAADILGRELPMLLRRGSDQVLRGSIDLLYREKDGSIVVADYKTDRETRGENLRGLYGKQLEAYADAVRHAMALAEPPRTEIWLLRTGSILPL